MAMEVRKGNYSIELLLHIQCSIPYFSSQLSNSFHFDVCFVLLQLRPSPRVTPCWLRPIMNVLGRDIVDFLEGSLHKNIAEELNIDDGVAIHTKIERAFLMTDAESRMAGIETSGATVAVCLIKVHSFNSCIHTCI